MASLKTLAQFGQILQGALQWERAFTMLKRSEDQGIKMDTES